MLAVVASAALVGVDAVPVVVEVDVSPGLPAFAIVGLGDQAVNEARERVRAALRNSGLPFPAARITVNLAPADLRKAGPLYDLPIALGLLVAQELLPAGAVAPYLAAGELALNGDLRPIHGAVNLGLLAGERGLLLPAESAPEAAMIEGCAAYGLESLRHAVRFLGGELALQPAQPPPAQEPDTAPLLLEDVKGQAAAKRALVLAAAGGHNLLMTGPPGSGKSMLAARIAPLLPPLSQAERLEVTRVHSAAGLTAGRIVTERPFRAPHHTVSDAGLIGGGSVPRPGEVSLAHHGVLFLDELPEYSRSALETLRQPLESGEVTISRARMSLRYPARFQLVAAQNPCPCGHLGDPEQACRCTPAQRSRYLAKLSGPLLDRIDLILSVPRLSPDELSRAPEGPGTADVNKNAKCHSFKLIVIDPEQEAA